MIDRLGTPVATGMCSNISDALGRVDSVHPKLPLELVKCLFLSLVERLQAVQPTLVVCIKNIVVFTPQLGQTSSIVIKILSVTIRQLKRWDYDASIVNTTLMSGQCSTKAPPGVGKVPMAVSGRASPSSSANTSGLY